MEVKCMNNKNAIKSNNNYKRRHNLPSIFMKASKYEDNKEIIITTRGGSAFH